MCSKELDLVFCKQLALAVGFDTTTSASQMVPYFLGTTVSALPLLLKLDGVPFGLDGWLQG